MATDPQKEKSGLEHTAQAAGAVKGAIKGKHYLPPLIFCHRCSSRSCSSSWFGMRTNTVPVGN